MIGSTAQITRRWPREAIAAGYRHSVALTADGTVLAAGDNRYGQCDVSSWREIVAVAAGNAHTGTRTRSG